MRLSTEKDCLEIQFFWSTTLLRNLGEPGSKLQESHDCNLGQPKSHRGGTQHHNVSCRANTQRKTPDSSEWRPWIFDGTHAKSFPARTREHKSTIHAIRWTLPWPEKNFQNGSSICRYDPEKIVSRIPSTIEPEIEVGKRTCAITERMWTCLGIRWLCERLWVQTGTDLWDFHWERRCWAISEI